MTDKSGVSSGIAASRGLRVKAAPATAVLRKSSIHENLLKGLFGSSS
jgi:hypothetical protein